MFWRKKKPRTTIARMNSSSSHLQTWMDAFHRRCSNASMPWTKRERKSNYRGYSIVNEKNTILCSCDTYACIHQLHQGVGWTSRQKPLQRHLQSTTKYSWCHHIKQSEHKSRKIVYAIIWYSFMYDIQQTAIDYTAHKYVFGISFHLITEPNQVQGLRVAHIINRKQPGLAVRIYRSWFPSVIQLKVTTSFLC